MSAPPRVRVTGCRNRSGESETRTSAPVDHDGKCAKIALVALRRRVSGENAGA